MSLIYRGGQGGGGGLSVSLPVATQIGDYIVVGSIGDAVADARMTKVYDPANTVGVWTGYATTLDPIALEDPDPDSGPFEGIVCATFEPPPLGEIITAAGFDNSVEIPSVHGGAAICLQMASAVVTAAGLSTPPGYTAGIINGSGGGASQARVDYWNSTSLGESPAVTALGEVTIVEWWACVIACFPVSIAPPCRLYPRSDQLGQGAGRLWPPPTTQQAGRLNSSY